MALSKKQRDLLFMLKDVAWCDQTGFAYEFQAYLDLETGEISRNCGLLRMDHFIEYCPPKGIREETICHLRGQFLEDYTSNFEVEEVVEINVKSSVFNKILEERRKPIILHDDLLGTVMLERSDLCLQGWITNFESEIIVLIFDELELSQGSLEKLIAAYKVLQQLPKNAEDPFLQALLENGVVELSEPHIFIYPDSALNETYSIFVKVSTQSQVGQLEIFGNKENVVRYTFDFEM